ALEFSTIPELTSVLCSREIGKQQVFCIETLTNTEHLQQELIQTTEYVSSLSNQNAIPSLYLDPIAYELKMLRIEDSFLEASGFIKIATLVNTANEMILFIKKFQ